MPSRKKFSTPARRGGKQQVVTPMQDPSETDSIETPSTASLDKMAEVGDREDRRSPSPGQSTKMEDDPPLKQETESLLAGQAVAQNTQGSKPGPADPSPRAGNREKLSHSGANAVTNGTRQDSSVTYPESEPEDELPAADRKQASRANDTASVSETNAADMDVEPDGETSSRETANGSYSTGRIRHTSPISAQVLQNVRALKEEILNGGGSTAAAPQGEPQGVTASSSQGSTAAPPPPGITPVTSHTSTLDECTRTLQERAASILSQASKTPNSSPGGFRRFNRNQQGGRFQGNPNSSPHTANPPFKSRFNDAPSGNAPSNRSYQNSGIAASRSWTAGSGADTGSRLAIKRDAAESGNIRNFEADETRSFKRQRNESPVEPWRGPKDTGRAEGPLGPGRDVRRENDRLPEQDRLSEQNRYTRPPHDVFRGGAEGSDGPIREMRQFEPVASLREPHNDRIEDTRHNGESRPFSREDARGQSFNRDDAIRRRSPSRDRYESPNRRHDRRTADFQPQDRPVDNRPVAGRFTGPNTVPSFPPRPVTIPANAGISNSFPPPAQFGARGPPLPASTSQPNGRSTSGFSKPLSMEQTNARASAIQELPASRDTRFNAGVNGPPETNKNALDPQPPTKTRVSRFSAAVPPTGTQSNGTKIPPAAPLPSLTTANLGRNFRDQPAPRTFGIRSVSGKSDDGRSVISESRRYVFACVCGLASSNRSH